MNPDVYFVAADESELNDLLLGEGPATAYPWTGKSSVPRIPKGSTGVLAKRPDRLANGLLQPVALIAPAEDQRRLFGRISQVRSDLSPITAWCHVLSPDEFSAIDSLSRDAHLGGYEAAWTGLSIAHALLLSERPIAKLKIAACFATETFAIARASALWEPVSTQRVLERYDGLQQLLRTREPRNTSIRKALEPIWNCLAAASSGELPIDQQLKSLVFAIRHVHEARLNKHVDEAARLADVLNIPEADVLHRLSQLSPEVRVREFDRLVETFNSTPKADTVTRHKRAIVAAYLSTVAAGGGASLSLLEPHAKNAPELLAWAYVLGSLGQRVIWTSAFDGLGRLVARELMRPLHLDEGPLCDFAIDEAAVVVDAQLADPLVHLRVKQSRIVSVAMAPGVNIQVAIADTVESRAGDGNGPRERTASEPRHEELEAVTEAVWRRLRARIDSHVEDLFRRRSSKKSAWQEKLPLKGPNDK